MSENNIGRYALIEAGVVTRVTRSTPELAAARGRSACPDEVGPGWTYDGETFSPPPRDLGAEWAAIRARRNRLLAESDWTQVVDAPVDQAAWAAYRQALRDMPESAADPQAVVWPVPPT